MTFNIAGTYHPAVFARKFVKASRGGSTLVVRTTSLIMTNVVSGKDIGDEFHE